MKEIKFDDVSWEMVEKEAKKQNLTVQQYFDRFVLPEMLKKIKK